MQRPVLIATVVPEEDGGLVYLQLHALHAGQGREALQNVRADLTIGTCKKREVKN